MNDIIKFALEHDTKTLVQINPIVKSPLLLLILRKLWLWLVQFIVYDLNHNLGIRPRVVILFTQSYVYTYNICF